MIPIVEDVISEAIEERLKFLKSNVDILDRIFSGSSVTTRNKLKEYITNSSIKVIRGFPITQTQLPAYCIMLGGEQEQPGGLNNFLGGDSLDMDYTTEVVTEVLPFDPSSGVFQTTRKPLVSIDSFVYEGTTYEGEYANIMNDRLGIVKISGDDMTETSIEVTYTCKKTGFTTHGTMFHSQYRVECWATNGDLSVIMYHLLKWIFLAKRLFFSQKNLVVQGVGGMDFEPAPEYFPEFVYRRALTFESVTDATYDVEHFYIDSVTNDGGVVDL